MVAEIAELKFTEVLDEDIVNGISETYVKAKKEKEKKNKEEGKVKEKKDKDAKKWFLVQGFRAIKCFKINRSFTYIYNIFQIPIFIFCHLKTLICKGNVQTIFGSKLVLHLLDGGHTTPYCQHD